MRMTLLSLLLLPLLYAWCLTLAPPLPLPITCCSMRARPNLFVCHAHVPPLILVLHPFFFNGLELHLSSSAKHLGHILSFNLSDSEDIIRVKKDLVCKANSMLCSFSSCNPLVITKLLRSFCLSLYGSSLWFSSSPELRSLETTFNKSFGGSGLFLGCAILAYFIVLLSWTASTTLSSRDPQSFCPQPWSLNPCWCLRYSLRVFLVSTQA